MEIITTAEDEDEIITTALKRIYYATHFVKSVQIQSFFWSVFSCIRTKY